MPIDIDVVDPTSPTFDEDVPAWHAVYVAAACYGRPTTSNPWSLAQMRATLATDRPDQRRTALSATVDGQLVGAGLMTLPLLDNLTTVDVDCLVLPEHRRRGVGAALLAAQERIATDLGRSRVFASVHRGPGEGGVDLGGEAFARSHGYAVGLVDLQSRLDLPVDPRLLDALAEAAAPHHEAYSLRTFSGPVPDEFVASYAQLDAIVDVEAPTGDLEIEPQDAEVSTWRGKEAQSRAQGRTNVSTAALDADGEVVALTELWRSSEPDARLQQWSTIVRRDHRGHRLGVALKVANLRRAAEVWPDAAQVVTWNAEDNVNMLEVNRAMGFRVVETSLELQKVL
ncbi:GNAT family N-acetyltransferase [Nocardioides zeae]|uniref:GNAT family N-acetyltransferase n=1 Tax=Nocardioides imazamoxiresistens TaxID=3231893 RepID=A0ABU3PRJ2_9ACTN|nr:GNAT family N-acetyltransferase [Nocardioides zeae]MDT9591849.1 GNAT family N-acetyltransferase [Nocardioides zeae]